MPFSRDGVITAFDINTGLVWILGGYYTIDENVILTDDYGTDDIYQWNMTSDDFTYVGALSRSTYSKAQNWVNKDRMIYWVYSGSIHSFNITSAMEIPNDLDASFPYRTKHPCVTTDNDKYLIIVGGAPSIRREYTQIYSFETKVWLSNMPRLNQGRSHHSCHVYNASYVYAIAGWAGFRIGTVEKLDLETMSIWTTSPHQLTHGRNVHRSVLINDFIVVAGGYDGSGLKSVEIISMVDDSITQCTDLNIVVMRHGIIRGPMNNVIVIGGYTSSGYSTNKIQVSNTLSSTRASDFFYPTTDDSNTETTDYSNTKTTDHSNLSNKSINPDGVIHVVVGTIFFFIIWCYWMRRKTRNKDERAGKDDPQTKVNDNEGTGVEQGEQSATYHQREIIIHFEDNKMNTFVFNPIPDNLDDCDANVLYTALMNAIQTKLEYSDCGITLYEVVKDDKLWIEDAGDLMDAITANPDIYELHLHVHSETFTLV
eukprot:152385_1